LLEHSNVFLTEGEWPMKAYSDAIERARARDAATYMNYGWTRPRVVSQGAVEQHTGTAEREAQKAELKQVLPIPTEDGEGGEDEMDDAQAPEGPVTEAAPAKAVRTVQTVSAARTVKQR
jgi:hypothetical protein